MVLEKRVAPGQSVVREPEDIPTPEADDLVKRSTSIKKDKDALKFYALKSTRER